MDDVEPGMTVVGAEEDWWWWGGFKAHGHTAAEAHLNP